MEEHRLIAWFLGELDDSELTLDEIEWLDDAVLEAVINKITTPVH